MEKKNLYREYFPGYMGHIPFKYEVIGMTVGATNNYLKSNLPKDKDIGYDIDKAISIIKNSETPEIAEQEILRQLKIKGMPPTDRSSQLRKMGLDEEAIAEYKASLEEVPDEFQLQFLLDIL